MFFNLFVERFSLTIHLAERIVIIASLVSITLACTLLPLHAFAQKPLTPIFLGQIAALTGPTQFLGLEARKGIEVALAENNKKGGIQGRMVLLKSLDDQADASIASANAKRLTKEGGVVGLIGSIGTSASEAIAQVSALEGVPLLGPMTGSDTLRGVSQTHIFHVRASHGQEVARLVEQIRTMGMKGVSVAYQNDPFGKSSVSNLEEAARRLQLTVASKVIVANNTNINKAAVEHIAKNSTPVIVVLATYDIAADFIKQLRASGNSAMLMTTSVAGAKALNDQLLDEARGMGMSQVMPYPWSARTAVVSHYQRALIDNGYSEKDFNYSSLEGYIAARVAIEALRKIGKDFSGASFQRALEALGTIDLGGYFVRLSQQSREGSSFIDMTVISASGRFLK